MDDDKLDGAMRFQTLLQSIFEVYLPNDKDYIKLGNVTFTNDNGAIWQDISCADWDVKALADSVVALLMAHSPKG